MPTEFVTRLKEFVRLVSHCTKALHWGYFMSYHTCEFCGKAHGIKNIGVPAGCLLFVAPEMIAHYIEQHGYAPPAEFVAAVMGSPLPDSPEYLATVDGFRKIHIQLMEKEME